MLKKTKTKPKTKNKGRYGKRNRGTIPEETNRKQMIKWQT